MLLYYDLGKRQCSWVGERGRETAIERRTEAYEAKRERDRESDFEQNPLARSV